MIALLKKLFSTYWFINTCLYMRWASKKAVPKHYRFYYRISYQTIRNIFCASYYFLNYFVGDIYYINNYIALARFLILYIGMIPLLNTKAVKWGWKTTFIQNIFFIINQNEEINENISSTLKYFKTNAAYHHYQKIF